MRYSDRSMTVAEQDAVEAARRFLASRGHVPWSENSVRTHVDVVEGRAAWVVTALDALPPGDEEWMRGDHEPVRYFVDAETGRLFGFEVRSSRTILP